MRPTLACITAISSICTAAPASIIHGFINATSTSVNPDFDGNGQYDIGCIPLHDYQTSDIHVEWIGIGRGPGLSGLTAPLLPLGGTIGSLSTFADESFLVKDLHRHVGGAPDGPLEWSLFAPGSPSTEEPVFIGFRIGDPATGSARYGWLRYHIVLEPGNPNSFASAFLMDYGFETEFGVGITAGAVPAPGSAAMFGVCVLLLRRRR